VKARLSIIAFAAVSLSCGGRGTAADGARGGDADDRHSLRHDGRDRSYLVRVPPSSARRSTLVPLVIVLHGGGGNGGNAEMMTGFTAKAGAEGFIVVYPDGTARRRIPLLTWNAGHCCGYAMQERVDDTGFIRALIDDLATRYPIDADRVYVTGMSNGAMLAHRIGMALPDRVAAIAPVVGAVFGDEDVRRTRVSAIMINGMLDEAVPFRGGAPGGRFSGSWDGTPVRPALDQTKFWAAANGCGTDGPTVDRGAYLHTRHDCPSPLDVELYAVKDNGHAWPGGRSGSAGGDTPSAALSATDVIWTFFEAHPKR
jgi:polyhydroxybutyrate depolymerase